MKSLLEVLILSIVLNTFVVLTLVVKPGSKVEIPTEITKVKYETIEFDKRVIQLEFSRNLIFTIDGFNPNQEYTFKWLRDSHEEIHVNTIPSTDPEPGNKNMYATMTTTGNKTIVSLVVSRTNAKACSHTLIVIQNGQSSEASIPLQSAPVFDLFKKPKRVLQADQMRISCKMEAYPKPTKVSWYFAPIKESDSIPENMLKAFNNLTLLSSSDRVTFSNDSGVFDDTLKFENLLYEDNGLYVCKTENILGNDTTILYLNVKNRWDALWPFIGVIIEVTVLVTAILLFERHQMRSKKSTKPDTKNAETAQDRQNNNSSPNKTSPNKNDTTPEEVPLAAHSVNHMNELSNNNDNLVDDVRQRSRNV